MSLGRLGVHILDTASGPSFGHHADQRFLMRSISKLLASAVLPPRVDRRHKSIDRRVVFGAADVLAHPPMTKKHVGGSGMTLGELCAATTRTSDNAAAHLILARYGCARALTASTAFTGLARGLGDRVTQLD